MLQVERVRVRCRSKEGRLVDGWVRSSDKHGALLNFKPFATDAVGDQGAAVEEGTPPAPSHAAVAAEPAPEALSEPQDAAAPEDTPYAGVEVEAKLTSDE
jgi:hypothetical protein